MGSVFGLAPCSHGAASAGALRLTRRWIWPPSQRPARWGQQILAGRGGAFFSRRPRGQTKQGRGKAVDQPQGWVERERSGLGFGRVEIVPAHLDRAQERRKVLGSRGRAFFSGRAGVVRPAPAGWVVSFLQRDASLLHEGLAQARLDGLHVGHSWAGQTLAGQPQEGGGFLELLVGDLLRREFFLPSWGGSGRRVI
jgi:hypothetical protein